MYKSVPALSIVRAFLAKHNITNGQAAELVGVSPSTFRAWKSETNRHLMPWSVWALLCYYFDENPHLFDGADIPIPAMPKEEALKKARHIIQLKDGEGYWVLSENKIVKQRGLYESLKPRYDKKVAELTFSICFPSYKVPEIPFLYDSAEAYINELFEVFYERKKDEVARAG
jgi:hypothetical protein